MEPDAYPNSLMASLDVPPRSIPGEEKFACGLPLSLLGEKVDDKFKCGLCGYVLKDPVQGNCGHRFCKQGIEQILKIPDLRLSPIKCPQCENEEREQDEEDYGYLNETLPDYAMKRELNRRTVRCLNQGCDWQGLMKEYFGHEVVCPHQKQQCPHCGQMVAPSAFKQHSQRDCPKAPAICQHCDMRLPTHIRASHYTVCPKYPCPCDICSIVFPRDQLMDHRNSVNSKCVGGKLAAPCNYGCMNPGSTDIQEQRQHAQKTLLDHLETLHARVGALEGGQVIEQLKSLEDKIQTLGTGSVTHGATSLPVSATQPPNESMNSNPASDLSSTIMSTVERHQRDVYNRVATFESVVTVVNSELRALIERIEGIERQQAQQGSTVTSLLESVGALGARVSNMDNSGEANRSIDIPPALNSTSGITYDGSILWVITDWSKKRDEAIRAVNTSFYSSTFYTGKPGYKMCCRLYPNGDGIGKGTHVSLFFVLMKGPCDELMSWPFRQKVTFTFIDQGRIQNVQDAFRPDPTSSSFRRPVTEMNIASGCPLFMPLEVLENQKYQYQKNDTVFIRIEVDCTDLKPETVWSGPAILSSQMRQGMRPRLPPQ